MRISTLYEKRRPRTGQLNSLVGELGQSMKLPTTSKRRRETQSDEKAISAEGCPAPKRKRVTTSRRVGAGTDGSGREVNIVAALLKYYSLPHLITILQTSPFTTPLTLHCKIQHKDEPVSPSTATCISVYSCECADVCGWLIDKSSVLIRHVRVRGTSCWRSSNGVVSGCVVRMGVAGSAVWKKLCWMPRLVAKGSVW